MKNTLIILIVLLVLGGGAWFIIGQKNSAEISEEEVLTPEEGDTEEEMSGSLKEFTVSGTNFAFNPSTITVKKGDRVKITFKNTAGFHDFVIDEYGVATKQAQAPMTEVLEFTADKVGSFEFYCSVGTHRAMGMKGTLKVE